MRIVVMGLIMLLLAACETTPSVPVAVSVPGSPALGPYSSAVRYDNTVYLSGIVAFDAKTKSFAAVNIEAQFTQAMANLKTVLSASGSDLDHVIKVTVYLKNPADFRPMNKLYAKEFGNAKPARTTVPGVDWGRPDVLIELDVIAAVK